MSSPKDLIVIRPGEKVVSYGTKTTFREYLTLQDAYDYYNVHLFGGSLPQCLITYQRHRKARGYFSGDRFALRNDDEQTTDEIALNPAAFGRSDEGILSTLVHEMCHLWQHHSGKPSRNAYHNKEWGRKMIEVGLIPSATGQPGGKQTGQSVSHYIVPGGPFETTTRELLATGITLRWRSKEREGGDVVSKNKVKYTCPACGLNAWAKPDVHIVCGECNAPLESEAPNA